MVTSDTRRAELLDKLADHVLAHGLAGSSLRPLAAAAGLSDRMLLYHFKDKAAVMAATLECVAARMVVLLGANTSATPLPFDALRARLVPIVLDDALWPFMRLWLEMAARAGQGDALYREIGEQIGRGFLAWGAAQLDSADRDRDAARLLVTVEGMVLLKSIGLEDVARAAL